MKVPFNKPYMTGKELGYIGEAHKNGHLSGDGPFTKRCQLWIEKTFGSKRALLTHSGTAGLEMAAILADIRPGDEIIMPSYTFVSTANAFVLRGGVPVFVDIRQDTLNIDESKIEAAITPRTKAIVPVHYAGVSCNMDVIMDLAGRHDLIIIEDAAHAVLGKYNGKHLGAIGHVSALSFHETKNIISGEGGALLVNDMRYYDRAEVIREKGTDRGKFFRGEIDKYTWVDIGSSYLPSELIAAFLWAQMENAQSIVSERIRIWDRYHKAFAALEGLGHIRRPFVPDNCEHNGHMYYILLPTLEYRNMFLKMIREAGIGAIFHYIPLDMSRAGRIYASVSGSLDVTHRVSDCVVRLPLWMGMTDGQIDYVIDNVIHALKEIFNRGVKRV